MKPTPADIVVLANDPQTEFGPYYIKASKPWDVWFAEQDVHPFLIVHNPGGHNPQAGEPMMQFHQFSRMVEYAKANPSDKDAQARADWKAFTRGMLVRRRKGLWTGIYLGGFKTVTPLPGESTKSCQERLLKEIKPIRDGKADLLILDAEKGPSKAAVSEWTDRDKFFYDPRTGVARLFSSRLTQDGIECGIEPCTFEDYAPYHSRSILIQDVYWISREYTVAERNALGLKGLGASRWDTGSHKARPLRRVSLHPRVYRKVDTLNETKANMQRHVDLAREAGHIPCVVYLHRKFVK